MKVPRNFEKTSNMTIIENHCTQLHNFRVLHDYISTPKSQLKQKLKLTYSKVKTQTEIETYYLNWRKLESTFLRVRHYFVYLCILVSVTALTMNLENNS